MFREVLYQQLELAGFQDWVETLRNQDPYWFSTAHHGDFERWNQALKSLPPIDESQIQLNRSAITVQGNCQQGELLLQSLQGLKPWRKGPFQLADVYIDTEWRSDFKWDRIYRHLSPLRQRRILDVGCGNGYHCWRMLAHEPDLVLGIDPSMLFNLQFRALQHYIQDRRIHILPVGIQHMPQNMQWFDTVFSMGVLYHRKSPVDHLLQLKALLKPGGELCLETLVIEGGRGQVLVPGSRYARMNNVWFLPSTDELTHWLDRCGFRDMRVVDLNQTTLEEQRSTEWMPFESLAECLDPHDLKRTVEGYSAPLRAVVVATK